MVVTDLKTRLEGLARAPRLLVACDFDGTLVPVAPRPALAKIERPTLDTLRALAELPRTDVAVISGRSRGDLASLVDWPAAVRIVGSHGLERDAADPIRLNPQQLALLDRLTAAVRDVARTDPCFVVEEKPAGVALHHRLVALEVALPAVETLVAATQRYEGVFIKTGDQLIELFVMSADKGAALSTIRFEAGAVAAFFVGDDVTDEDAFAVLNPADVGVKVGPGSTQAPFRVRNPREVVALLEQLAVLRRSWLETLRATPIERHSVLSDQRTVAVVDDRARIVWLCLPRLDSSALFAELLGNPADGFFEISPAEPSSVPTQCYVDDTLTLTTTWPDLTVTDYLDCSDGRPFQRAGRSDLLRVISGSAKAVIRFAPRLHFGRTPTRLTVDPSGVRIEGTHDPIVLRAPGVRWEIVSDGLHDTAVAEVALDGRELILELRYGTGSLQNPRMHETERRRQTEHHWKAWMGTLTVPPFRQDLLRRSALTLRSLCYRPSGGIAAAATTSLPEFPGGVRNWDYRYCWVRDAALSAASLVRLGSTGQALRFLDWLMGVLERCESPESLRPLYTISGGHLGPEAEIPELEGYLASKPVRVGNAAADQIQLDVFGPIADLIALLAHREAPVTPEHWRLTEAMVAAVERRWMQPDNGIWEVRLASRHHVHSKVMCWVTLDRARQIAAQYLGRERPEWRALQRRIEQDIFEKGFKPNVNAFTASYEEDWIDAASLHVGLSGLIPPDDPRFVGTVDAVERTLRAGPTVYRYRYADGLPGGEGAFHLCTSWLIQSYALLGRRREAEELFNALADLAGPTGLFAEQYDPAAKQSLGNFPQAYSHLGLIDAALSISKGEFSDMKREG